MFKSKWPPFPPYEPPQELLDLLDLPEPTPKQRRRCAGVQSKAHGAHAAAFAEWATQCFHATLAEGAIDWSVTSLREHFDGRVQFTIWTTTTNQGAPHGPDTTPDAD